MIMKDFSEFGKLLCSHLSLAPLSLKVKAKPGGPQDPPGSASPSAPPPSPSSLPVPLDHPAPVTVASWVFLPHTNDPPTSGPLRLLVPPPGRNGWLPPHFRRLLKCHLLQEALPDLFI